jgi:opacity protein-like surface antigen
MAIPASLSAFSKAPAPGAAGGGNTSYGGGGFFHSWMKNFAFEAGGGFNAPNSNNVTYGGNFSVGAGAHFGSHISGLFEFQFFQDKLPGRIIAQTKGAATAGHARIIGLTFDPIYDFFPKATNDLYVTGGGGYFHKGTSFLAPQLTTFCYYFYCGQGYANQSIETFSSNSGGWSIGGGYMHRFTSMYGNRRTMKLFAQVRYLDIDSAPIVGKTTSSSIPPVTISGPTKIIPVTLGIRW